MKRPRKAQKFSYVVGLICYLCALISLLLAGYSGYTMGTANPIFASFAATVVFFIGSGVVLHVIGKVDLPDLRIDTEDR